MLKALGPKVNRATGTKMMSRNRIANNPADPYKMLRMSWYDSPSSASSMLMKRSNNTQTATMLIKKQKFSMKLTNLALCSVLFLKRPMSSKLLKNSMNSGKSIVPETFLSISFRTVFVAPKETSSPHSRRALTSSPASMTPLASTSISRKAASKSFWDTWSWSKSPDPNRTLCNATGLAAAFRLETTEPVTLPVSRGSLMDPLPDCLLEGLAIALCCVPTRLSVG
mmetsp:Transcript_10776/g.24623  ORF Transcript_10776/g.24623 Transcript_10776/m.24623 type:complete len:225 (-) Transcript_10776:111-785(-)